MGVLTMNNYREVNNDLLKDWLLFREDELSSLTCEEDRKHWVCFNEVSKKILNSILNKIELMFKNDLMFLMIISWIIWVIGMRSIIGMDFVMVFR